MQAGQLHWSFNHDHESQSPRFRKSFEAALETYCADAAVASPDFELEASRHGTLSEARYVLLPNFWNGYRVQSDDSVDGFSVGSVRVRKALVHDFREAEKRWQYVVSIENRTSGGRTTLEFQSRNDSLRTVVGKWIVDVQNDGTGTFRSSRWTGSVERVPFAATDSNWRITFSSIDATSPPVGPMEFATGGAASGADARDQAAFSCNWSMIDAIGDRIGSVDVNSAEPFSVLEDLQLLRSDVRLHKIGPWSFVDPGSPAQRTLTGVSLYGRGIPPQYWWLDDHGIVVVVSTIFTTMVLQSKRAVGKR